MQPASPEPSSVINFFMCLRMCYAFISLPMLIFRYAHLHIKKQLSKRVFSISCRCRDRKKKSDEMLEKLRAVTNLTYFLHLSFNRKKPTNSNRVGSFPASSPMELKRYPKLWKIMYTYQEARREGQRFLLGFFHSYNVFAGLRESRKMRRV